MRDDIGETESEFRYKATASTNKLLELLIKHHGDDEDIDDRQAEILRARPLIDTIQIAVAESYGVTRAEMISDRRNGKVVMPRHVAMYLSRELTPRSLPAIGRRFGDRDHTSIHFAVQKITRLIAADPILAARVETIRARFEP
jgi:chromosomal replication initiator protein